jgi:hypothetical protein
MGVTASVRLSQDSVGCVDEPSQMEYVTRLQWQSSRHFGAVHFSFRARHRKHIQYYGLAASDPECDTHLRACRLDRWRDSRVEVARYPVESLQSLYIAVNTGHVHAMLLPTDPRERHAHRQTQETAARRLCIDQTLQ